MKKLKIFLKKTIFQTQVFWAKELNLIVGAAGTSYHKWISTEKYCLDISKKDDFDKVLGRRKINKLLAEHVLEHLDDITLKQSISNIHTFLVTGGNFRIAVPDGYHSDLNYIDQVKPGGTGDGSDDHKHLFNYQTLSQLLTEHGFQARLIEYWDEKGQFHSNYKNSDRLGYIKRSLINDQRNYDNNPNYTSLIIDAIKL